MKKVYLLICLSICFIASAWAQNGSLTFFSDKGEKFWVLVNSVVQNERPESNVKIASLAPNFYRIKIVFEIDTLGEISSNLNLMENSSDVYLIKKKTTTTKGKPGTGTAPKTTERYVLRAFSSSDNGGQSAPTKGQDVIVYGSGEPLNTEEIVNPVNTTVITTTTSKTGTSGSVTTPNNEGINFNLNIDPANGNMNVNLNGTGVNVNTTGSTSNSTSTTTTTTTTTKSSSGSRAPSGNTPPPAKTTTVIRAMSSMDFDKAVASIKAQTFEDNKLMVAKQVIKNNYLNCNQIKTVMKLLTYENSKVDFAKAAYDKCVEKPNYYLIYDAFTYSTSSEEINEYIEGR